MNKVALTEDFLDPTGLPKDLEMANGPWDKPRKNQRLSWTHNPLSRDNFGQSSAPNREAITNLEVDVEYVRL